MTLWQTEMLNIEKFVIRTPESLIVKPGRYQIKKASAISASALEEIKELLRVRLVQTEDLGVEQIPDKVLNGLIDEIGTEWTTKQGNWPKRFAKVIKQRRGQKLNSDFLSVVGKIARESCVEDTGRDLIITENFDWEPGTYGDTESCFWGCRAGAKLLLEDNGGMALLIHGSNDEPLARAWCVPYENSYIVFNCYAVRKCPITIVTFARALSDLFNLAYYRNIGLTCRGINCGPLWINHSDEVSDWEGGRAYIIGPQSVSTIEKVDLEYDPLYCDNCEDECDTDAYVEEGKVLCQCCWESSNICYCCEKRVHEDDVYTVEDEVLCPRCFDHEAFTCFECEYHFWKSDRIEIEGRMYCKDCVSRHYVECSVCSTLIRKSETCGIDGNDEVYCEKCWEEHTFECRECCDRFDRRDEEAGQEYDLCNKCFKRKCAN